MFGDYSPGVYLSEVVDRNKVSPVLSSVSERERKERRPHGWLWVVSSSMFSKEGKIYIHKVREGRKKILGIEPLFELAHVLLCVMLFEEG